MENKHTPTPWQFIDKGVGDGYDPTYEVYGDKGQRDLPIFDDKKYYNTAPGKADAIFIVRACNSHEKLLSALKAILKAKTDSKGETPELSRWLVDQAREAIAEAGGGT